MKLPPDQWKSLAHLLDEAVTLPESDRLAWAQKLGAEHGALGPLLAELFANPAAVATADIVATLPSFSAPAAEPGWRAGALVGAYRLIREIGRGGMGAVWLAQRADGLIKREVALKLPIIAASHQALVERFAREREALAPLVHPHIARLYDAGFAEDGQPYLALEYVAGEALTTYCDRLKLPVRKRVELFAQVVAAVQYAHANLVLHRDLKPSNILVTAAGEVKLLDFGIAKLMAEGAAQETALTQLSGRALTLDYAAPEQIAGAPLTTASDVYSLGVVLYELLSGARPYRLRRGSRAEVEEAILAQEVAPPSAAISPEAAARRGATARRLARQIGGDLDTVVLAALRKAPSERYVTAEAFAQDIDRCLRGEPVLARRASAWYRLRKFVARNKLAFATGGAVAASLVVGTGLALWQAHVARLESTRANASKAFVDRLFESVARSNPGGAAAADTTARQLLDAGSRQLLDGSAGDPEVQLDLLQWFARLNAELDLLDPAGALAERSVTLAAKLHGPQSLEAAGALAVKADTLYREARYVDTASVAEDALRIAERQPAKTLELRARMHILIGNSAFQLDHSKTEEPQRHFEQALALLEQAGSRSEERSRAAYYLAWIKEVLHDYPAAKAYYLDGIAAGQANFGEKSFIVAFGYENLADLQRKEQRLSEAHESIRKAIEIYEFVLGPRHGTAAFARTTLALIEAAEGHYEEAARSADAALALAENVFGEHARQTGYPASYAARIKANRGELAAAARAYDRAIAVFVESEPPSSLSARMLRVEAVPVAIALGEQERAAALLAAADAGFAAAKDVSSIYAVRAAVAHAELDYARGNTRGGRAQLEQALKLNSALKDAGNPALPRLAAVAARYERDRATAQEVLDRLHGAGLLPSAPEALRLDIADEAMLEVAVGRLYLVTGDVDPARSWLAHAAALRESIDVPQSLWLAEAEAALGEAMLASGRKVEAQRLVARAQEIRAASFGTLPSRAARGQ